MVISIKLRKFDHITPALIDLHWLPVKFRVQFKSGADLGGGCRGCAPPSEMTCGLLIQLVFCKKKNYVIYWC